MLPKPQVDVFALYMYSLLDRYVVTRQAQLGSSAHLSQIRTSIVVAFIPACKKEGNSHQCRTSTGIEVVGRNPPDGFATKLEVA